MQIDAFNQISQLRQAMYDAIQQQSSEFKDLLRRTSKDHGGSCYARLVRLVQESVIAPAPQGRGSFNTVVDRTEDVILKANFGSDIASFLTTLRYKEMPRRKGRIAKSYDSTYAWIFTTGAEERKQAGSKMSVYERIQYDLAEQGMTDSEREQREQSDREKAMFINWLSCSESIFWVTGKAGSGISTLMKSIDDEPRTKEILRHWVESRRRDTSADHEQLGTGHAPQCLSLVTASFYFWSAGTEMQRTQQGLLQSLLFQILGACPDLVPEVCPERWSARESAMPPPEWSQDELESTIRATLTCASQTTCFCFFIDGLDEYAGDDPYALLRLIDSLRSGNAAKFCVSSRPWNVFRKEYGGAGKNMLTLEAFTKPDMTRYIEGNLLKDPRFLRLARRDARADDLALEVSERANGVFFWVYLVVNDLLRGMNDDDDVEMLYERLRALPTDLEVYFQRMLDRLNRVYQQRTAQVLLIALTALSPVSAIAVYCLEHDRSLAGFRRVAQIQAIDDDQYQSMRTQVQTLTKKWCRDLCCVSNDEPFGNVEFLHRTVKDFLNNEAIYRILEQRAGNEFSTRSILCRTHLAQLQCAIGGRSDVFNSLTDGETIWLARTIMFYVKEDEIHDNCGSIDELEELGKLAKRLGIIPFNRSFLAWTVSCALYGYADFALKRDPELLFCEPDRPPLVDWAYENDLSGFTQASEDPARMVQMLTRHAMAYDQQASKKGRMRRMLKRERRGPGRALQELQRGRYPIVFML